jgi:hypothetical protein
MAKAKPKSQIMVADGTGGLVAVMDRRFEQGDWPIGFEIPREKADSWFSYLYAECARRGWSYGDMGQLDAKENSGSLSVSRGGDGLTQLAIVWERKRNGPLKVRAKSAGAVTFQAGELKGFFDEVNRQCLAGITERVYRRGHLHYNGLAWRGELWLDETIRLGPPTVQYESACCGPRVILIDAQIDCAGRSVSHSAFDRQLRELSAFLSVVLGTRVHLADNRQMWTFSQGLADCAVRSFGYFEPVNPDSMPPPGAVPAVPFKQVTRPDFSEGGIDGSINELAVPSDMIGLWQRYRTLGDERRRAFLQAAAKWQEALAHWGEERTLSFALMVVACESLKPAEPQYKDHNLYPVIEALLGKVTADRLQEHWFRPQQVRSAHLHRGEFLASELFHDMMTSSYYDPTFDQAHRELCRITQAAFIEWLERGGVFTMRSGQRRTRVPRWFRDRALFGLLGLALGGVLGWLLAR